MPSIASVAAPSSIRLEISPASPFIDDELAIRILGLKPRETVTLRASTEDDDKRVWTSHAMFSADSSGIVDVTSHEPLSGTYRGISPMGLFWSMNLEGAEESGRATFVKKNATANKVTLEVRSAERVIATTHFERSYLAHGTEARDLQVPGEAATNSTHTVGRLFLPPGAKAGDRLPVVIVLSGSGGGFDLDKAARKPKLMRSGSACLPFRAALSLPSSLVRDSRKFAPLSPTRRAASSGQLADVTSKAVSCLPRGRTAVKRFLSCRFLFANLFFALPSRWLC
jgi:hypothetical protein